MSKKLPETSPILESLLSDISNQSNDWRGEAAVDMAWRDNIQWSKEQRDMFRQLSLPDNLFVNLIAPAMDAVTGFEAKHRVDWMITPNDEADEEMAEAMNHELNSAMRLSDANTACSDAYESQAGVGIGWVHVTSNPDPLSPSKLMIENIHRDEMFWDMRARSCDLRRDCRWIARRKFHDKDEAKQLFVGQFDDLIDFTFSDWQTMDIGDEQENQFSWFSRLTEYTDPIELIMDDTGSRPRVAIYEVNYKVIEPRNIISMQDGNMMEFRRDNMMHVEMLSTGQAEMICKVPINVVKVAWFIGPHIVYDGPSMEPHNNFPYVPFFGPREDATNAPTGLIRRMRGPQEEYNRAAMEIQRILSSRRIEKDHDAVVGAGDYQTVVEINRPDGVVNLKPGRKFQVIREWEKVAALERICERARNEINAASGIYQTFQGQTETGQSGIAVESIAQLGEQTLSKINANYQLSRKAVGDLAFSHLASNLGSQRKIVSIPQSVGQNKKEVVLNDGPTNQVSMMRAQVAIQDVHTSAGYKQHTHQRITSIIEKVPDEFKSILLPFWLETSDMPKKEQAIKLVNKKLGYEEDEQKRAAQEEAQAQEAAQQKEMEMRQFMAEIMEKEASAKDKEAQSKNHLADALKKRAETAKLLREFKMMGMGNGDGSPGSVMSRSGGSPSPSQIPSSPPQTGPADPRQALPPGVSGVDNPGNGDTPAMPRPGVRQEVAPRETTL